MFLLGYGDLSVYPFLTPGTGRRGPCDEGGILTPNLEMMAKKGTYDICLDESLRESTGIVRVLNCSSYCNYDDL